MISVSSWFDTWMKKQQLNLLRKLTYDDIHESTRWESFGSISRASDSIISGGTSIGVINSGQYWNKFLSDKSNLRKTATLQLAIGIENTIARAGVARAGITASGLVTLKSGSVISSGIRVPRSGEWLNILTGWGDDPEFIGSSVSVAIRDKFAGLFEKALGSDDSPIDYYSAAYNPADLTWDILTTYGGLDSTASTANTDIDYATWSTWKTACASANLSLSGKLTGQSIKEALELIRDLTNSDISVDGSGLVTFLRRIKAAASGSEQSFNTTNATDFVVRLDSSKIVNYLEVFYDFQTINQLAANGGMEATNSWSDRNSPTTNERSAEQANSGSYSRKIVTTSMFQGAYQDVTTIIGRSYTASAYFYVSTGDAVLGVGSTNRWMGHVDPEIITETGTNNRIYLFAVTAPATGTLRSICLYIDPEGSTGNMKCAIYEKTDTGKGSLVTNGTTEQKALIGGSIPAWMEFSFSTFPSVTSGKEYFIAIWCSDSGWKIKYVYESGSGFPVYRYDTEYNSYPANIAGTSHMIDRAVSIFARYKKDSDVWPLSGVADSASWVYKRVTFTAIATTTRIYFESDSIFASTFYVDNLSVKWQGPEYFSGSYVKEDATSQTNFGKAEPEVYQSKVIWHKTLASATSFADRRIESFADPLEVVQFTAFMEGQIAELGDIIKVTNSFFSYADKYFRIHKILDINLAAATIRLEAADFDDIS